MCLAVRVCVCVGCDLPLVLLLLLLLLLLAVGSLRRLTGVLVYYTQYMFAPVPSGAHCALVYYVHMCYMCIWLGNIVHDARVCMWFDVRTFGHYFWGHKHTHTQIVAHTKHIHTYTPNVLNVRPETTRKRIIISIISIVVRLHKRRCWHRRRRRRRRRLHRHQHQQQQRLHRAGGWLVYLHEDACTRANAKTTTTTPKDVDANDDDDGGDIFSISFSVFHSISLWLCTNT